VGLATRVIPILLWGPNGCVKGRQWDKSRCIGSMADRIRLLERRDIDELIILDVSKRAPRFNEIHALTDPLFCPVTVGGGVKSIADMRRLLAGGADKVSLNSAGLARPDLIEEACQKFGSQAVVVSIDVGRGLAADEAISWAVECERRGAGEILLTSMDRDGMMDGYDLEVIRSVSSAVSIPVIAAGGCGSYDDMVAAFQAGAHAVGVGAAFQFKEMTPKGAARHLSERGIATRI